MNARTTSRWPARTATWNGLSPILSTFLGRTGSRSFRKSAIHASVTSQNWWFDARVSSDCSRAVQWAQGLRAHLWRTFGSRRALSFFDFGFGPHPKNTHGGGAESAGGGKIGVG